MVGARIWHISDCLGSVHSWTRKERRAVERRGISANMDEGSSSLTVGGLAHDTTVVVRFQSKPARRCGILMRGSAESAALQIPSHRRFSLFPFFHSWSRDADEAGGLRLS